MPWLNKYMMKNLIATRLLPKRNIFARLAKEELRARGLCSVTVSSQGHQDFRSNFLKERQVYPNQVPKQERINYIGTLLLTGADSLHCTSNSCLSCLEKLQHPVKAAEGSR